MGKQHTFRTTNDTEWMDDRLNSMGRLQKSEFIRNVLATELLRVSEGSHTSHIKHSEPSHTSDIVYYSTDNSTCPPIEEIPEEDTPTIDAEAGFKNLQNLFA